MLEQRGGPRARRSEALHRVRVVEPRPPRLGSGVGSRQRGGGIVESALDRRQARAQPPDHGQLGPGAARRGWAGDGSEGAPRARDFVAGDECGDRGAAFERRGSLQALPGEAHHVRGGPRSVARRARCRQAGRGSALALARQGESGLGGPGQPQGVHELGCHPRPLVGRRRAESLGGQLGRATVADQRERPAEQEPRARAPALGRRLGERALEQEGGLPRRAGSQRAASGRDQRLGDVGVARRLDGTCMGHQGHRARTGLAEYAHGAPVRDRPHARRQVCVDRRSHDRMPEAQRTAGREDAGRRERVGGPLAVFER